MGRIRRDVAACRVPLNAAPDELTAINQIQALPAFQTIFAHTFLGSGTPFGDWFDEMATLIANDHDTHGPCEDAEESVVRPLVNAINERAVEQRWVGTPGQIQGGTGAGTGISNVKNSLVTQAPTAPKQQLVLPPKKAWPPVGQVGVSDDLPGGSTRRRPGCPFGRPGVCRHRRTIGDRACPCRIPVGPAHAASRYSQISPLDLGKALLSIEFSATTRSVASLGGAN